MEVHRVRVLGAVDEPDPQQVALAAAERRTRDPAVVGPGRELDAGRHLDLLVGRDQLPLAEHPAACEPPGLAVVEVAQDLGRVEAVGAVVDARPLRGRSGRRCRGRWRATGTPCPVWPAAAAMAFSRWWPPSASCTALVRDDLVQGGERRTGGESAAQQAAAAQAQRAILIRLGRGGPLGDVTRILSFVHNRDFDTSKKNGWPAKPEGQPSPPLPLPRIRLVTTIELDGQYRALREEAGMAWRRARSARRHGRRRRRVPPGPAHQRDRGARARRRLLRRAARPQGPHAGRHAGPEDRHRRDLARPRAGRPGGGRAPPDDVLGRPRGRDRGPLGRPPDPVARRACRGGARRAAAARPGERSRRRRCRRRSRCARSAPTSASTSWWPWTRPRLSATRSPGAGSPRWTPRRSRSSASSPGARASAVR